MRIVTWNCHHGRFDKRLAELKPLRPDMAVLQECSPSAGTGMWFPTTSKKGVGIWSGDGYRMKPVPCDPRVAHSVFPVALEGPETFHVLAVWTQALPSYVGALLAGLDAYSDFVLEAPTVLLGDFNSAPNLQAPNARRAHETLIERLRSDWGLVSAYHNCPDTSQGAEMPTYYHQFARSAGYHLDYCFVPIDWVQRLSSVRVAGPEEFTSSDHRPVLVELLPVGDRATVL